MSSANIYDIADMTKNFESFQKKFKAIVTLGEMENIYRCKLGHYNDLMYINRSYKVVQGFSRWYYGESRENLFKYLDKEFNNYICLLEMITLASERTPYNSPLITLRESNLVFIKALLPGFKKMKEIYKDYSDLNVKIDRIQTALFGFITLHGTLRAPRPEIKPQRCL